MAMPQLITAGGLFYPLIVETTFVISSPFAVDTLKNTAARATARNGLPTKKGFRSLIQQLSVCLWRYNAVNVLSCRG